MRNILGINCGKNTHSQIVIGSLADDFKTLLPEECTKVIIITDAKVHSVNLDFVNSYEHIVIGQGESSKTFVKLEEIYSQLLSMGADRKTFIIGMGGGIVTDITGFVASTYMRGVRFGLIPTTLLAQVDASIGGKNGINLDGYKNIVGTFNQPDFVICDPALLSSLGEREFRAGLAEIIKAGIIGDPELFSLLEQHTIEEIRSDKELLHEVILKSIQLKTSIVQRDEREHGERRKLNLGHTFAHAIEKSFSTYSHGEAVAAGIAIICNAAEQMGLLSADSNLRIRNLISKMGLPLDYTIDMRRLLSIIKTDKKREGTHIYLVLPKEIGDCTIDKIPLSELENIFANKPSHQLNDPHQTESPAEATSLS